MDGASSVNLGSRGPAWIARVNQNAASTSPTSLQPRFGCQVHQQGHRGTLPTPSSQGLCIFPASRQQNSRQEELDALSSIKKSQANRSKSHDHLHDIPYELIDQEFTRARSATYSIPAGSKTVAIPYQSRSYESDVSLVLFVGGPNDTHLYIASLSPPSAYRHEHTSGEGSSGTTVLKGKRQKRNILHSSVRSDFACVRTTAMPAYISQAPITAIKLGPLAPQLLGSRKHEGPWISIHTMRGTYLAAVHHNGAGGQASNTHRALPEHILCPIAAFVTDRFQARRKSHAWLKRCPTFSLGRYPAGDILWEPGNRTAALVADTVGNVWRWTIDRKAQPFHWLAHGQRMTLITKSPLNKQELRCNQKCELHWVDEFSVDTAVMITERAIWGIDIEAARQRPLQRLRELARSPHHLQNSIFRSAVNTGIAGPLDSASLEAHSMHPLLIVVSSTSLHVLDAINPSRELLSVLHYRPFDDATLRLVQVPNYATYSKTSAGSVAVALVSELDSMATLYIFDCESATNEKAQPRAVRAWQACAPAQVFRPFLAQPGADLCFISWNDLFQGHSAWSRWQRLSRSHAGGGTGSWLALQRTGRGEVWIQAFDLRGPRKAALPPLRIDIYKSAGVDELALMLNARAGVQWHKSIQGPLDRSNTDFERPSDCSKLLSELRRYQDVTGYTTASSDGLPAWSHFAEAIRRIPEALAIAENPRTSIVTGLDLLTLASLDSADRGLLVARKTPKSDVRGAISAVYAPHSLLASTSVSRCIALAKSLAHAVTAARTMGNAWWDGQRCDLSLLLGTDVVADAEETEGDAEAMMQHWMAQVDALTARYIGSSERDKASTIGYKLEQCIRSSLWQIVLQVALSNEVWSHKPIKVTQAKALPSLEAEQVAVESQQLGMSQPGPWNDLRPPLSQRDSSRSRRQDSVFSQGTQSSFSKRRRLDSIGIDGSEGVQRFLSGGIGAQQGEGPDGYFNQGDDEMDVEAQAKKRLPEPEEVQFSYFTPTEHTGGGPVTTRATRLLLSSWSLSSLDPEAPEDDPSYYTYSDPYALLDAAKATAQGDYTSASGASDTDGESTGWSSAWTSETSNRSDGGEMSDATAYSQSHSVWGGVRRETSSQRSINPLIGLAHSQPLPSSSSAGFTRFGPLRRMAPPSISSSQRAAQHHSATPDRRSSSVVADRQSTSLSQPAESHETRPSQASQVMSTGMAATQPLPGSTTFVSRRAGGGNQTGKRPRKRLGGF